MGRAYAIPMANHPAAPDRLFLGAAENGPASWPGYRTVRAGPYNTVKFSRNTSAQTGGAKTQILRSDDAGKTWNRLENGLPAGHEHMTCGFAVHPNDGEHACASAIPTARFTPARTAVKTGVSLESQKENFTAFA